MKFKDLKEGKKYYRFGANNRVYKGDIYVLNNGLLFNLETSEYSIFSNSVINTMEFEEIKEKPMWLFFINKNSKKIDYGYDVLRVIRSDTMYQHDLNAYEEGIKFPHLSIPIEEEE